MIRILHTGDVHLGVTRYGNATARGNSRLIDFAVTLVGAVDAAIEHDADMLILAGDTFDTRHERPEERAVLTSAIARTKAAGITTVIIEGNHDGRTVVGDESSSAFRWLGSLADGDLIVITSPTVMTAYVGREDKEVRLAGLPYPHKRALDRVLADLSPGERVIEAGRRLEDAIRIMAAASHTGYPGVPAIYVGHQTVGGAVTGTERAMRFDDDVAVAADAFDGFDYAALGHIHRQQRLSAKAWYAGAPEYIDFGEEGDPKGFLLVDVEGGREPVVTVIPSAPRPVRTVEATELRAGADEPEGGSVVVEPGGRFWRIQPGLDDLDGAMVRLLVAPQERARAEGNQFLRRMVLTAGASFVKTEVIRPQSTPMARAEIDSDLGPIEATRRHLTAKGLPPERIEAAMTVAAQLIAAAD